jgi:hypothetical protein
MTVRGPEVRPRITWRGPREAMLTRVDPNTYAEVKERARRSGMSMSDWIGAAVRQALRS